ncbi:MAG: hypothetical protein SFX73_28130 [Kofleriaceae bacterium]|nr:hypothetical protein [Kofleriaceae bacterium]
MSRRASAEGVDEDACPDVLAQVQADAAPPLADEALDAIAQAAVHCSTRTRSTSSVLRRCLIPSASHLVESGSMIVRVWQRHRHGTNPGAEIVLCAPVEGAAPLNGAVAVHVSAPSPHWLVVSQGFTELWDKESDDPDVSGFGFKLSCRIPAVEAQLDFGWVLMTEGPPKPQELELPGVNGARLFIASVAKPR